MVEREGILRVMDKGLVKRVERFLVFPQFLESDPAVEICQCIAGIF